MHDEEEEDPDPDEIMRKMSRNCRIVSQACDRFFAAKGLRCYDLKGNEINPVTKQLINQLKCKPTLTD
jgi:hypothetical protein